MDRSKKSMTPPIRKKPPAKPSVSEVHDAPCPRASDAQVQTYRRSKRQLQFLSKTVSFCTHRPLHPSKYNFIMDLSQLNCRGKLSILWVSVNHIDILAV